MRRLPRSWSLVVSSAAGLAVAASCSPVERQFPGAGGAGGASATSTSGNSTTGVEVSVAVSSSATGTCADTEADTHNCGVCGHDCAALPHVAGATCAEGKCVLTCAAGYADCAPGGDDGCETPSVDNPQSCGCSAVQCALTQACGAGVCADNFTSCAVVGTCVDSTCQTDMRFSVDALIAADLTAARRLWQRATKGPLDYPTALSYCASLTLDGINSGWRVPSGSELASILLKPGGLMGCSPPYCAPATDQATFAGTVVDEYWTSDAYMSDSHYCVSFCDGRKTPYKELDTSTHYVRCVHDPVP